MGHSRPFFVYFRSFSNKYQCKFCYKSIRKNVHSVCDAGIQTHDLQIASLIPLDQGSLPKGQLTLPSFCNYDGWKLGRILLSDTTDFLIFWLATQIFQPIRMLKNSVAKILRCKIFLWLAPREVYTQTFWCSFKSIGLSQRENIISLNYLTVENFGSHGSCRQCDLIAWSFLQYLAIYNSKNLPNGKINLQKKVHHFAKYLINPLNITKYFKIWLKWQYFSKSGHIAYRHLYEIHLLWPRSYF